MSEFTAWFVAIAARIDNPTWEPTDLRFISARGPVHLLPANLDRMLDAAAARCVDSTSSCRVP